MQLNRDIIFGLSDVFGKMLQQFHNTFQSVLRFDSFSVYIGGLGGFFLGCSLITFAEFVFFLTWRLFK